MKARLPEEAKLEFEEDSRTMIEYIATPEMEADITIVWWKSSTSQMWKHGRIGAPPHKSNAKRCWFHRGK